MYFLEPELSYVKPTLSILFLILTNYASNYNWN